ncbi:MAG: hypothetical protein QOJ37_3792, partial [Pseudonocardiales bacterium]|nr:hypothetical protein [Pseudonocardiales bacterium]
MKQTALRAVLTVAALVAALLVVMVTQGASAQAAGPLSHGSLTMVSTLADGTSGPSLSTAGADHQSISDDGKVIAFSSPVPAQLLVTDPTQTGHVNDTNGVDDVFVWDSRVPSPIGPIVSLVSINNTKTGSGDAASVNPIVAPKGLGVVFESGATNLTSVPVGSFSNHIYAWVPLINALTPVFMVDENYQNSSGSDSLASDPSIAVTPVPPVARIAFTSSATDLVDPAVHLGKPQGEVYVRTYTVAPPSTQMVSVATDGNGTDSGASEPMISADALHVVFTSGGDGLIAGINGTGGDIFERNLLTSSTTLISKQVSSAQGSGGNNSPVVSADGNSVAWGSNAPDLVLIPKNANAHVYYKGLVGAIQLVDTDVSGLQGCDQFSNSPGISLDGTMVDYESGCTDSVAPITSSGNQVFARRMFPSPTVPALPDPHPVLISVNDAGTAAGNGGSFLCPGNNPPHCGASTNPGLTMNADGTAIAFMSSSSDIGRPPNFPPFNSGAVYVRYPDAPGGGTTANLSVNAAGQFSDQGARDPVMSADGGSVAFVSLSDDFGMLDTNGATDIFESDIHNTFAFQPVAAVNEGDGTVTITVGRSGNLGTSDQVEVTTGDGSTPDLPLLPPEITNPGNSNATAPADYTAVDKTLVFPPGVPIETFTVPIVDDNVVEDPELFNVSLSNASGAGTTALPGPLSKSYVVILDNDADTTAPGVTVEQAAGQVDPTSASPILFTA